MAIALHAPTCMERRNTPRWYELWVRSNRDRRLCGLRVFALATKIREAPSEFAAIIRDITEQKRNERALEQAELMRRAKEEAELANRAKSEFLIRKGSHEIRTPLTAILGFIDVLGEHPSLRGGPSEIEEHLATIRQNGQFLLSLIDDLLDISRIESGQFRVESEPCSPVAIVSNVVESLRAKAEGKHLQVVVEYLGAIPSAVSTDRLRLQQVLVNLLDNAIKFTERGTVRVTTRTIDRPAADPVLEIAVRDTGIGMTAAEMTGLFQPFYRVPSLAADHPVGTGLGLAICKRIARRLGGDVTVQSTKASGSIFTLSIPAPTAEDVNDSGHSRELKEPRALTAAGSKPRQGFTVEFCWRRITRRIRN